MINSKYKVHSLIDWSDDLKALIADDIFVMSGKDLPDADDPTDPVFNADIIISNNGAVIHLEYEDESLPPIMVNIPSLTITNSWNKKNLSYLKHWLLKVLDDSSVYRANTINIIAVGGWNHNIKL